MKKRLDDGGRKAMADEPKRRAAAEALMLMHAVTACLKPARRVAP